MTLRRDLRSALFGGGIWSPAVRRIWPRAVVLAYHRVARTSIDPFGQAVTPATFERQLRHLRARYEVVTLDALVDDALAGRVRDRTVAVTFDDGYADTLEAAAPIAAAMGAPCTVFVTVQPVLDQTPFWWDELTALLSGGDDERPLEVAGVGAVDVSSAVARGRTLGQLQQRLRRMSWEDRARALTSVRARSAGAAAPDLGRPMTASELQRLASLPGVTIGAHTMTHPALSALGADAQLEELVESRRRLEVLLARPISLLAYPFGKREDVSAATTRAAEAAGYRAAVTTMGAAVVRSSTRFEIPRITAHEWSDAQFDHRLRDAFCESVR